MTAFSAADPIVILSYARTPMGSMQGALSDASATDLGATAVKAAVERAGIDGGDTDRVYMGCVLPAGLGQAPARQAAIKAGLPKSVQATTVNKVCGSGMQTVIMGAEALASGTVDMVVAGGMESMTNAPYLLKKHRSGARIGHDTAYDHMFLDGLEDAYEEGRAMGTFAQDTANEYQLTRESMDEYSIESLRRANSAIESGAFAGEVVPVTITSRRGETVVDTDEAPGRGKPDKNSNLAPSFREGRYDHRSDLQFNIRRSSSGGPNARKRCQGQRPFASRQDCRDGSARPRAIRVHHRSSWRNREGSRWCWLVGRRCRSVGSE